MNAFAELTVSLREKKGMRQKFLAEQVGLDPTRLNRIEKGRDNPPKPETVRRMAEVLELSEDQTYEYIRTAGYNPDDREDEGSTQGEALQQLREDFISGRPLPAQKKRSLPEPPPIGEQGAKHRLEEAVPAWRLKSYGTLTHANLLAFWIWNALIEGILYPTMLIGKNVFEVFTDGSNIERIAMPKSVTDFWYVKMFMFVIIEQLMTRKLSNSIKDRFKKYPVLKLLYEYAYNHPEEEPVGKDYYTYNLELKLPQELSEQNAEARSRRLTFTVELRVMRDEEGKITDFIASYTPRDAFTKRVIAEKHQELTELAKQKRYDYVQSVTQKEIAYTV